MKTLFFGGTFDPPHIGHEKIVEFCLGVCDKLVILPNEKSPHKQYTAKASSMHRFNMLNLLFDNEKVIIDEYELNSKETNYTYLTIKYLKEKYSNDLTMVIGYDQLINLKNWYNYKNIIEEVSILCFNRYDSYVTNQNEIKEIKNIKIIEKFKFDVESSFIREKMFESDVNYFRKILNPKVLKYINKNKLYES